MASGVDTIETVIEDTLITPCFVLPKYCCPLMRTSATVIRTRDIGLVMIPRSLCTVKSVDFGSVFNC